MRLTHILTIAVILFVLYMGWRIGSYLMWAAWKLGALGVVVLLVFGGAIWVKKKLL